MQAGQSVDVFADGCLTDRRQDQGNWRRSVVFRGKPRAKSRGRL